MQLDRPKRSWLLWRRLIALLTITKNNFIDTKNETEDIQAVERLGEARDKIVAPL